MDGVRFKGDMVGAESWMDGGRKASMCMCVYIYRDMAISEFPLPAMSESEKKSFFQKPDRLEHIKKREAFPFPSLYPSKCYSFIPSQHRSSSILSLAFYFYQE